MSTPIATEILSTLKACYQALDEKKAENIVILDVRGQSTITDFMIIASGNSDPHLRALKIALESMLDEKQVYILGADFSLKSGWAIVDGVEFMVHLMLDEHRKAYHLETLWPQAIEIKL